MDDPTLTKPPEQPKTDVKVRQLSIRMHPHEHTLLMALLKRDEMSFQKLYNYIVSGYLNADPRVIAFLREQRELERVPQEVRDSHALSWRERSNLFDEIAKGEK